MNDFQVVKKANQYDVCIIGSGAGGGMAAHVLAKAGVKICLLEAGLDYDVTKNTTLLKFPYESP
jgi:choline dehydrogenase-like flavoprotein